MPPWDAAQNHYGQAAPADSNRSRRRGSNSRTEGIMSMTALRVDGHHPLPVPPLTLDEPELYLVHLMAEGLALATIARRLDVSERTLRRRIRKLCERLEVDSPVQVVVWAAKAGLV